MKKLIVSLLLASSALAGTAQTKWTVDAAHSSVRFAVTHLTVAKTVGYFSEYDLNVTSSNEDFSGSQVELTIQANSINTANEARDKHLKGPDFFDAEKYPTITFKSTSFKKTKGNQYKIEGDLTMHGVTKKVTLDGVYGGTRKDPYGNTKAGFAISGKISRKDFNMAWGAPLEGGGNILDDMVDIACDVELKKN